MIYKTEFFKVNVDLLIFLLIFFYTGIQGFGRSEETIGFTIM